MCVNAARGVVAYGGFLSGSRGRPWRRRPNRKVPVVAVIGAALGAAAPRLSVSTWIPFRSTLDGNCQELLASPQQAVWLVGGCHGAMVGSLRIVLHIRNCQRAMISHREQRLICICNSERMLICKSGRTL